MTRSPLAAGRPAILLASALLSIATSSFAADPAPSDDRRAQAMALMESCRADAQRLCADTEPGRGHKLTCLDTHKADVSPACRDALPKLDAMRAAAAQRGAAPK